MKSYLAFFLAVWLLKEPLVIGADALKDLCLICPRKSIEDQCDAYCFSNTKDNYQRTVELEELKVTNKETIQKLMKEINKGDSQRSEQNKQLKSKDGEVTELTKNIKGLRSELFVAKAEVETRDAQISDKTNQLNSYIKNITDYSELLKSKDDKVNSMTKTINDLESKLDIASNQIRIKDSQIADQNKLLETQDGKVINSTENIKNLRSELSTAKAEIETRDAQINEKTNQLNSYIKNITNQSELLKSKDDKVNDMTETIGNLERELAIAKNETKIKDSQIREQNKVLETENDKVIKLTENIVNLQNEIKNKDEHIATKDSQIDGLNNQTKSNAEKITKITEELAKCNRQDSCPIDGPSGIYSMKIRGLNTFEAPCNSTGWQTIQKRFDGSENFDRTWKDYKDGFGNIEGEFFIGLERLHIMTEERPHELYIKLGKVDGSTAYAYYDDFKIGSEGELYELKSLGIYNGTAGDSLEYHKNMKFTTRDRKNDNARYGYCAIRERGGWWYNDCAMSTLNGKFFKEGNTGSKKEDGIYWGSWHNEDWTYSLTFAEMMIRPKTLKTEA